MFKPAIAAALASALLVSAQRMGNGLYHPHAAFAFVQTGDRTPIVGHNPPVLTALGAQQMFQLGQSLRTRYISGTTSSGLGVQHISGISADTLDNNQILIQTSDELHLVSSAQALVQGLYPPHNLANSNGTGGPVGSLLANGSAIDYPLGGYQYANIQSSGQLDAESIYVAGSKHCPMAQRDAVMYYTTNKFKETRAASQDLYNKLNVDWFDGNFKRADLNYINAIGIYDYLKYQYAHNSSIYRTLANDSAFAGVYENVRALADEHTWYLYGNTSSSTTDSDIRAIAGKTLASSILGSFQMIVADKMNSGDQSDMSYPLTFFFGEQEPFVSLISIIMADHRDDYFRSIPAFGSAMIFELFSSGENSMFPGTQDQLWIRFYFHNGTNSGDNRLTAYPIFGNGPSRTDMPYKEFKDLFSRVMLSSIAQWCDACDSGSLFCLGVNDNDTSSTLPFSGKRHSKISPVVGGVIGAIVTLVVAGLLIGLAMLLVGLRFHRVQRNKKSDLGGFKGSAKLASDPDLSLAKNGALPAGISFASDSKKGHERVESWELRQKERSGDLGDRTSRESFDTINVAAAKPIQPEERV